MNKYETPTVKEIELVFCDVILTSSPNLGDIFGGAAEWLGALWN